MRLDRPHLLDYLYTVELILVDFIDYALNHTLRSAFSNGQLVISLFITFCTSVSFQSYTTLILGSGFAYENTRTLMQDESYLQDADYDDIRIRRQDRENLDFDLYEDFNIHQSKG